MKYLFLVSAITVGGCAHTPIDEDQQMKIIEANISLPTKAVSLRSYRRHYAFTKDDPNMVTAVYAIGGQPRRLWLLEDEMPIILDGGCKVISFQYNVKSKLFSNISCNG
jgi:hypothetical protein